MPKTPIPPLLFAVGLFIVATLMTTQMRRTEIGGLSPRWDGLHYQAAALEQARGLWAGDASPFKRYVGSREPEGFLFVIAVSHLLFGAQADAPYWLVGFFGLGALIATYLLSRSLGAGGGAALLLCALWALSPNFIFQNFFETRNDLALAMMLALAWRSLLLGRHQRTIAHWSIAGALLGIATLLKMSAPGYAFWGIAALVFFEIWREPRTGRIREILAGAVGFAIAFSLVAGWHYFPGLHESLKYYSVWSGQMSTWQSAQYGLATFLDRALFYPQNLWRVHLAGVHWALPILGAGVAFFLIRQNRANKNHRARAGAERMDQILTVFAGLVPLVFLTAKGAFASAGDTPVFPLLIAAIAPLLPEISMGRPMAPFFRPAVTAALIAAAATAFYFSATQRPRFHAIGEGDQAPFLRNAETWVASYGLDRAIGCQTFSHPYLNVDALRWHLARKNPADRFPTLSWGPGPFDEGEGTERVARLLFQNDFLITADKPVHAHGGESFNTLNRLQGELQDRVSGSGRFLRIDSLRLPETGLTLDLWVRKDYARVSWVPPAGEWEDGWVVWGARLKVQALVAGRIQIRYFGHLRSTFFILEDGRKFKMEVLANPDGALTARSPRLAFTPGHPRFFILDRGENAPRSAANPDPRDLALLHATLVFLPE